MIRPPPLSLGTENPHRFTAERQPPSRRATFSKAMQEEAGMGTGSKWTQAVPWLWNKTHAANDPRVLIRTASPARLKGNAVLQGGTLKTSCML